jgi:hypothetical protein
MGNNNVPSLLEQQFGLLRINNMYEERNDIPKSVFQIRK